MGLAIPANGFQSMSNVTIDLEDDLLALLRRSNQPVPDAVRELMVLELYREGWVAFDQAAALTELRVRWIGPDDDDLPIETDEDYG